MADDPLGDLIFDREYKEPVLIETGIQESLIEYQRLSTLADDAQTQDLPQAAGAWARIDGTAHFLIYFPECRLRLVRNPHLIKNGGAPTYKPESFVRRSAEFAA